MAPRLAVLISTLLLLGGCVKRQTAADGDASCGGCHAPHYVQQGSCQECHRGDPGARRKALAHARLLTGSAAAHTLTRGPAVTAGRRLVEAAACRRCHSIGGTGNRLATNLDRIAWKRDQAELAASTLQPVDNMPSFGFDREQADTAIAFLLQSRGSERGEDVYQVRFTRSGGPGRSVFEEKCGGCHRVLSPTGGPLGSGRTAPDLSGLFTPFYPATAPGDRPWTATAVADWIRNPRAFRPATTMLPVVLTDEELRSIRAALGG